MKKNEKNERYEAPQVETILVDVKNSFLDASPGGGGIGDGGEGEEL